MADTPETGKTISAAESESIPKRRCVGCGAMADKRLMYRVARLPDGALTLDPSGKMGGRGAYMCRNPECLKKASKCRGLERSFKVQIPQDIYESLKEEIDGRDE